ncbi:hypothetical protein A0H81_13858 [Grifola frondosa]|uniref:Heterokaryon incompatibility domain-containing protein n=1 Tax=Grifola frondosa TaxID=5627 RepID=A0A1C7LNJ1_GRIFR|nr:hypothetical protein A0H81_13858 [Grifola frondosa]
MNDKPLRLMVSNDDGSQYHVVPFAGQPYIAISYCWPGDWTRLYSSQKTVNIATQKGLVSSSHFSQFAKAAVQHYNKNLAVWMDQHCIDQSNMEEKYDQVAILQRIYFKAHTVLILLEDVQLRLQDLQILHRHKATDEFISVVRSLLKARWFSRAWCSQESVLSARPTICVHQAGQTDKPLTFTADDLWGWIDIARFRDASIPRYSSPRGSIPDSQWATSMMAKTSAWAFGIVYQMGCSNQYDKAALTLNLLRHIFRFNALPEAFGHNESVVIANVVKMVNLMAIQRGDFSFLLVNHGLQNVRCDFGFGWAGVPIVGDRTSEMWSRKDYDVGRDADITFDATSLVARGVISRIARQHIWRIRRDSDGLHVCVDGEERLVDTDWLPHTSMYANNRHVVFLRDLLCALEAFDHQGVAEKDVYATTVYAYLLEEDYREQPNPFFGDMKEDMKQTFATFTQWENLAYALEFIPRDGGGCFSTVLLDDRKTVLVVSGNVEDLREKTIFQPHIIRPKLFSPPMVLTVNTMVLEPLSDGLYQCSGGLRGFGLIAEISLEAEVKIRIT